MTPTIPQRTFFCFLTLVLGLLSLPSSTAVIAESPDQLVVGNFSLAVPGGPFPQGWKPLIFEKITEHTQYDLVKDEQQVMVKAVSRQSFSGLTREISLDPKEYPVIAWRWKVENIIQKGEVTQKSGDDYPARLYITFQYESSQIGFFEKAKFETIRLIHGQPPHWSHQLYLGKQQPHRHDGSQSLYGSGVYVRHAKRKCQIESMGV